MQLLFEISEVALYSIDRELRALAKKLGIESEIVPLLGSVRDEKRLNEVMQRFEVDTVYHAAAYKHVPLVEQNIIEGVCNNVLGTLQTASSALQSDSSDQMLEEINAILQRSLAGTPDRGVRLLPDATSGVKVLIGVKRYEIHDVPDDEIKDLTRQAVAEWEAGQ